jgi:hypothetical protein
MTLLALPASNPLTNNTNPLTNNTLHRTKQEQRQPRALALCVEYLAASDDPEPLAPLGGLRQLFQFGLRQFAVGDH